MDRFSPIVRQSLASARLELRAVLRSRTFAAATVLSGAAAAVATAPVSPGLVADERHYLEAGASTVMLGGIVLSLLLLPALTPAPRGRWREEAVLALPVAPEVLLVGTWLGFSAVLLLFFAAAGGGFFAVALLACDSARPLQLVASLGCGWVLCVEFAAVLVALATFLGSAGILATGAAVVLFGQATSFWPLVPAALLPPFDLLAPGLCLGARAGPGPAAAVRVVAGTGFYLCLAFLVIRLRAGGTSVSD